MIKPYKVKIKTVTGSRTYSTIVYAESKMAASIIANDLWPDRVVTIPEETQLGNEDI